jgi:hypothetical protein
MNTPYKRKSVVCFKCSNWLSNPAVLHTHTRKLDYHPHIHIIVPAGDINKNRKEWRKIKTKYLFNGFKLATVFRARLISAIKETGLSLCVRVVVVFYNS